MIEERKEERRMRVKVKEIRMHIFILLHVSVI